LCGIQNLRCEAFLAAGKNTTENTESHTVEYLRVTTIKITAVKTTLYIQIKKPPAIAVVLNKP
jgi:hypothetical protein